jgi:hypothetical protein
MVAMASNAFIVDRKLGAVPVARLLDVRTQLRDSGNTGIVPPILTTGRPVLEGGQSLEPDVLYPHEVNAALRYYLPRYRIATGQNGHPSVELRFGAGEGAEVGRLTITLAWSPPAAPTGTTVLAMDHVAAVSLRYRVRVQGAEASAAASASAWEQTVALQPLQQQSADSLARSTTVFTDKTQFDIVYQAMRDPSRSTVLDLHITAPLKVRTWRQVLIGTVAAKDQIAVLQKSGGLFTATVNSETLSTLRPNAATTGGAKVSFARPPAETVARVELTRAAVLQPAAVVANDAPAASPRIASQARFAMQAPAPAAGAALVQQPRGVRVNAKLAAMQPALRVGVADTVMVRPAPAVGASTAATAAVATAVPQQRVSAATMARVNTPRLAEAVAVSDLTVEGRKAVPINVVLDNNRRPVLIDSEVENAHVIAFAFDPSQPENAGVFAGTGAGNDQIHLLLPLRLTTPDGGSQVVYQDNLMRDVIYVTPSEFRLQRDETAPFLPAISFLATEFSTTDNDQDAEVLFRVTAVYRLEPWLDPKLLDLAHAALAEQHQVPRFTTVPATDAKLELTLISGEQARPAATIDGVAGISDTLDLDYPTFMRLWRERLAVPSSGGIGGRVDFSLFDGTKAQVPVRLSLFEESADLFDATLLGPVPNAPGRYSVMLRNRVESPAKITGLPAEIVPEGVARAVDSSSVIGQVLQPQETRRIEYDVGATAPPLLAFEPTVLGRAETNVGVLLKMLLVTPGYTSLGFTVTVKAPAELFKPPAAAAEALVGLIVEFDDGTRANLSASVPQIDVTLVGRLADQLLGTADDSQRYFYRVTNLHTSGEGARTSWKEGRGATALQVGAAVVTLDF